MATKQRIFELFVAAGIVLFVLVAGDSCSSAFITNGILPLSDGRGSGTICSSTKQPKSIFALRMGYLDNLDTGNNKNMQGKDKDGKQVMPSFEEYMEV